MANKGIKECYFYKGNQLVDRFVSLSEAAKSLGMNRGTLRHIIDKGKEIEGGITVSYERIVEHKFKVYTNEEIADRMSRDVSFLNEDEILLYKKALVSALDWSKTVK